MSSKKHRKKLKKIHIKRRIVELLSSSCIGSLIELESFSKMTHNLEIYNNEDTGVIDVFYKYHKPTEVKIISCSTEVEFNI